MPTIANQGLFILTFNNMDSVRKLDVYIETCNDMKTDVTPYEDHQPTTMSISIDDTYEILPH